MAQTDNPRYSLRDLLRAMQRLRDPETGCPWDQAQDFHSIVPSTLEECYELAEAIEHEDFEHVKEELGDVLFQVVFYAQLARERGLFAFADVVSRLTEKLLRRHPHVFADGHLEGIVSRSTTAQVVGQQWEAIKQQEREEKSLSGVMADLPVALPALPRAQKMQRRAARVGFDWPDVAPVLECLLAEIEELRQALAADDSRAIKDEMGDVLFTCVNLARHLGLDAETTLRHSSTKFERRFRMMEETAETSGFVLDQLDDDELQRLWAAAKRNLLERDL